eukprot:30476-Pyramimonas_sp.AAC.1
MAHGEDHNEAHANTVLNVLALKDQLARAPPDAHAVVQVRACCLMFSPVGLKRTREDEQEVCRRCKTARQIGLRVMLAGPEGRAVGESGELDKVVRKGEGERW